MIWDADAGQKHAQAVNKEARGIVGADHTRAAATDGGEEGIRFGLYREVGQGALTGYRTATVTNIVPVPQNPLLFLDVNAYSSGTAALPHLPARALQWQQHSSATVVRAAGAEASWPVAYA